MICQQCHTEVADDLIFCTNCGARLFEPKTETPTVLIREPIDTNPGANSAKSSSSLKWVALIIALVALPASIFGIYLLINSRNNQQNARVVNARTATPTATPARRANSNQNANQNSNINSNQNANRAETSPKPSANPNKNEIMNERIEIAPGSNYAKPFEVGEETRRLNGKVIVRAGEKIDGYVYLKQNYEEYFPDDNYKVFSFGTSNSTEVRQTLVAEEYVLVFVNKTEKPIVVEGKFSLED